MGIRSAASPCSAGKRVLPDFRTLGLLLAPVVFLPGALPAQLTTGGIEGTLRAAGGHRLAGESILITGAAGFGMLIRTNSNGEFSIMLPYGRYRLSAEIHRSAAVPGATVFVAPLQIARLDLVMETSGAIRVTQWTRARLPGTWADDTSGRRYPEAFSLAGVLLSREPSSVTEPLDFTGLNDNRLAVESQRGFPWTDTQYRVHGMDASDSYQPGRPAILSDVQALDSIVVRSGFAQPVSSNYGTEAGVFLAEPGSSWHGSLSTADSGGALSSTNLPALSTRGLVRQVNRFHWLTRDHFDIGGPFSKWADMYASATGQWASQTEPLAAPGVNQHSRLLFGNVRGRIRAGGGDRFDVVYSGSRIDLSGGGMPAGIEALTGSRMAASFVLPGGFPRESETGHFDFVQVGWTHVSSAASGLGLIEVRYGYSTAHLDTHLPPFGQSRIELLRGTVTGAPSLANLAVRPRHEIEAAWQGAVRTRHQVVAGGGWKRSEPHNRFTSPSDMNLVTANGVPALVMDFNTPLDSRALLRSFSAYFADHILIRSSLSLDVGGLADFPRGSLPAQSSPAGSFAPARRFIATADMIAWNNVSPRAGFAWQVPHSHGLVLRGAYFRLYAPMAGRYLDFGNPNSLGGSTYQWITANSNARFQPGEQGRLLLHFGGPYTSISPALGRPYSDEFDAGAEFPLTRRSIVSIHLFRRDDKNRIAAINTGVPAQAFTPVSILDPGPDGNPGTFDDQRMTVYAQNPATLGQDHYLLTNPAGLRMLNTGLRADAGTAWRGLSLHASFVAEKSYGPTNPGNTYYENDPGVIGALFLDPNTAINASNRIFVDRAFVGKLQADYRLPSAWGGIELASVADYTDGLVFARRLLVTGLPQGPLLVPATVRGSPEGGNRAQYAINWNLRVSRQFSLPFGRLALLADILNVTNAGQRLQEDDLSGPAFNLRLPASIQPPRFVRLGFRYDF